MAAVRCSGRRMTPLTSGPTGAGPAMRTAAERAMTKLAARPAQASRGATSATMPFPGTERKSRKPSFALVAEAGD
jgi:hypothetical protein